MDNQNNTENIEKLIHDGNQFIYEQNYILKEQNNTLYQTNNELRKANSKLSGIIFLMLLPYIISFILLILSAVGAITSAGLLSQLLGL